MNHKQLNFYQFAIPRKLSNPILSPDIGQFFSSYADWLWKFFHLDSRMDVDIISLYKLKSWLVAQ